MVLIHRQQSAATRQRTLLGFCEEKYHRGITVVVQQISQTDIEAMFTLYRIVKRSVAESVPDRASVHTRTAAFEAVSAPEQYCSAPLLKVERSVSDRFLRRSESSLNTFIGAEIATEPRFGRLSFQIKRERCKLHNG